MKKNIIFGANNTAKHFLNHNNKIRSDFFVDNDESINTFLGKKVYDFTTFVKNKSDANIIICSMQFYNIFLQIRKFCKKNVVKFFFDFKKKTNFI